ncbi:MAG: serine protease [Candidatus Caldatribacteriota bacterium]|jgi:hypothetical protein
MFKDRLVYYKQLEKMTESVLLVYFTGDRPGFQTQMGQDVYDLFVDQLEAIGKVNRISLFLYSRGGDTNVAWSLCNLIRSYCNELYVIIPSRAHSAATLLSLGADKIYMTKQATLSPIDPSINTPLNPSGPNTNEKLPVSVESIKGFIQLAKEELGIIGSEESAEVLAILAKEIHPLVLGDVFRARSHIRMLARKLLEIHFKANTEIIEKISNFLCSDSWNHHYSINRKEAKESLGLIIEIPNDEMYSLIKLIYDDISAELLLRESFNPAAILGDKDQVLYSFKRALLETMAFGQYSFITKGKIDKIVSENEMAIQIHENRYFEDWIRGEEHGKNS